MSWSTPCSDADAADADAADTFSGEKLVDFEVDTEVIKSKLYSAPYRLIKLQVSMTCRHVY